MLNLSDKELDRFSQEAAQEYEPGEVLGPRSWDRLEVRMNTEFGSPGWNPIQHIRRWPFFYAPVMVVLLGLVYYLLRPGSSSGSSPGATVKVPDVKTSVQNQKSVSTDKATSTSPSSTDPAGSSSNKGEDGTAAGSGADHATTGTATVAKAPAGSGVSGATAASGANAGTANDATSGRSATGPDHEARGNAAAGGSVVKRGNVLPEGNVAREGSAGRGTNETGRGANGAGNGTTGAGRRRRGMSGGIGGIVGNTAGTTNNAGAAGAIDGADVTTNAKARAKANAMTNVGVMTNGAAQTNAGAGTNATGQTTAQTTAQTNAAAQNREISLVAIQRPGSLSKRTAVNDSALRAYNSKSPIPSPIKKKGVYRIDRKWQFGLMVAPDFTSVNSLAGDKAGSSIGLTMDYNFASHWYISTGFLSTRKNYAARTQDYHAPHDFYMQNGINDGSLNFVKGSFYMLEIPLNLRYDFLTSGNTLFFASAGVSSYFMTTENANFYWRRFNQDQCNPVDHVKVHPTSLISCLNLSAGVETGITNSMSLLIAPYVKLPSKNLGIGQVQMNSVGINFVLKWSPISSRKRD